MSTHVGLRMRTTNFVRDHARMKQFAFRAIESVGYDMTHWCRAVMYERCFARVTELGPENLEVLEISGGRMWRDRFRFKKYVALDYPEFDICADALPDQRFDLIIADQVFEHLRYPGRAAQNVKAMLKPGGTFMVLTPFMILVHPCPLDCHRWTEEGLRYLLVDNGFDDAQISTDSWGNRKAVKRNLSRFPRKGFGKDLRNEPGFPLVVWAWATVD